ncbi:NUDIX domain-containing protein [Streptomyces glomeratus]|uniref:Nudix hydrolase domain-containing protein n=1 Tax=Streptomyces glomeratus TaxID=284452 RepID=A0ABP6L7B0_9ACTN|nr:NUDIX hydrolase [Streptomyces glomeratus]MCF1509593.1 NUDIX hydrolase [Streptomyces glomeratus]
METRGPWRRHHRESLCTTARLVAYQDEVTQPDGSAGRYDWVRVPDQVRVAALVEGRLLVVEQYHYLAGTMWQLPGGDLGPEDHDSRAAARRELAEETGYREGRWTARGALHPLPGLTPARVHLWSAEGLTPGEPAPEPGETGLEVRHLPLAEAVRAACDGRIGCASSAALVLAVAAAHVG